MLARLVTRFPVLVAALWWGSLTTIGFLVVPLLFSHMASPAMAGSMAARLFAAQTWVSVVCGVLLLMLSRAKMEPGADGSEPAPWSSLTLILVLGGLLLALLSEFAVSPRIVARENLQLWHSVGSAMYALQWLCAGGALWQLAGPRRVPPAQP
jgi:hypothetical protein